MPNIPDDTRNRLVLLVVPAAGTGSPARPTHATLTRNPPLSVLDTAEQLWTPARQRLTVRQHQLGRGAVTQHGHWNWTNKGQWFRAGVWRLVAIESEVRVEGLMAVAARSTTSRLSPPDQLVYVDFLESAPWNNRELTHPDPPHRAGVGLNLLADAALWSVEVGLGGRVGLHALPQASGFYAKHGMRLAEASDPNYYGLPYFEYTSSVAVKLLSDLGIVP